MTSQTGTTLEFTSSIKRIQDGERGAVRQGETEVKALKTKTQRLITLVLSLSALSACGQVSVAGRSNSRMLVDPGTLQSASFTTNSNRSCRYNESITPDDDRWLDGSGYYGVCADSDDPSKISLFGFAPEGARQYCVFPALAASTGTIYPKTDSTGTPLVQCSAGGYGEQRFHFPQTQYNAVFVTTSQNRLAMQGCLKTGRYFDCPAFSYGEFR
ncbi:MAG: hypothetical protein RJB38_2259 [Pseudomonadota bacterium]|jgi:hypothetical protein